MNRDIIILREAINKVVQMLAGMGLRVTQRGSSAYVQTNPKTLKPELVNIPFIPDNATDELIHAIQGFMDHEVAHILFTDWKAVQEACKTPKLDSLHNIVEDPFIEREMGKKFPGAAHNIHVLHDFFIRKITQPALDEVDAAHRAGKLKGEAYEAARFSVLMVPLVRAWSGQFTFHDFMQKEGHYTSNKFVKLLAEKTPAAVIARIPHIKTSWEALDVARELHAVLYPPKQEKQPDQPGQGEPCEDGEAGQPSKDNKSSKKDTPGKGEKEHKNESKNADGDQDSNETPEDANNEAGEGDGEAGSNEGGTTKSSKGDKKSKDNKEKKDDADEADGEAEDDGDGSDAAREDGEGTDGGDRDESASDRDPAGSDRGSEGDESEDDAGGDRRDPERDDDGLDDQDGDGTDGEADGADTASDADGDGDDEDEQDGNGDDAGRGGDHDDADADEEGAGEADGDEDEGDSAEGKEGSGEEGDEDGGEGKASLSNQESGDQDIDIDDANTHSKADGGEADTEASGQPGIGHVDGDFEDIEVTPYSFEAMVRQHITDEAVRQTRGADYAIYSNEFDIFAKHDMTPKFQAAQFTMLEDQTRGMVGVMQKEIERMMAQRNRVFNVGGQKSGKLNAPGFSRILVNDPRVFKRKQEHQAKDTAVSLLVDNSGSMSGQRILTAMTAAYALSSTLDRVNIQHECLGFTTTYNGKPGSGYDYYKIEQEQRKLGVEYSRIVPLRITIFKDFTERLAPPVRHRFADMAYNQPNMMSNIDGEAVQIAVNRLLQRKEQRKVLLVLSDGMPAGGVPGDLYSHLHKVVDDAEKAKIEVIGIGIQTNAVKSFYPKNVVLNDVGELPKLVMGELKKILLAA